MPRQKRESQRIPAMDDFKDDSSFSEFLKRYPAYKSTGILDDLRRSEYARLDQLEQVYLDYTGGGLYSEEQVRSHMDLLVENVFGNPHSTNPTSMAMTRLVQSARESVLDFFHASPEEYICIFTQNASAALKLVGESYPFGPGDTYLLTFDNHNSVNGIREFARSKGAVIHYSPVLPPEMRIDIEKLENFLEFKKSGGNNLFAFPAQSNFSGVQHSLEWIERAHAKGWDVLLDGAAFVPTNCLDMSKVHPDFVSLSFYKIFGYPTGVGALIARRQMMPRLHRPWFAGGTITVASVQGDTYYLHKGAEGYEDGTLNYLSLPAVEMGLRHISRIGYDVIHTRVTCLTGWLLDHLVALKHSNGLPVVKIYGPLDMRERGGTITLNFFDREGHFIDHMVVETLASEKNISIRTGCFCNPGGGELALGISADELNSCFALRPDMEYQDFRQCIDDKSNGAVRISVGLVSNFNDVQRFLDFAGEFIDRNTSEIL
ncbi:MAG: aminotransferase class V-fold PLP-dependent enzyme [Leptolinea sp.]|jgi:molybdenum cofactor sulfurtransferase|nr:aminotransferase class V-fold PLP-dependent enzyme [Leptolinea sp.]